MVHEPFSLETHASHHVTERSEQSFKLLLRQPHCKVIKILCKHAFHSIIAAVLLVRGCLELFASGTLLSHSRKQSSTKTLFEQSWRDVHCISIFRLYFG